MVTPDPAMPDETPDAPPATTASDETVAAAPQHPDVAALDAAFARGDHAEARALATRLAASDDEVLRDRGRDGLDKLRLDPVIVGVFGFTGALIVALAALYLGHHH